MSIWKRFCKNLVRNLMAFEISTTARLTTLCLAIIFGWSHATFAAIQTPVPTTETVAKLIADLDSPKFQERQHATNRLRSMELKSVPSLVKLAIVGNAEQTWRAISILNEMGVRGDQKMVAKIGRVLFLLGNRRPELNQKALLIRDKWKEQQTSRVVAELVAKGATVSQNQYARLSPQARIAGQFIIRNGRLVERPEPESTLNPESVTTTKKPKSKRLISVKEIEKRTLEIIKARPTDDERALRAAAKIAIRETPEPVSALPKKEFDIVIEKSWRGTDADFQAILDLPKVYSIQLSDVKAVSYTHLTLPTKRIV